MLAKPLGYTRIYSNQHLVLQAGLQSTDCIRVISQRAFETLLRANKGNKGASREEGPRYRRTSCNSNKDGEYPRGYEISTGDTRPIHTTAERRFGLSYPLISL